MKIAVLHRYPPRQVIGTNASFVAFLEELSLRNHQVFYLTYKEKTSNNHKIPNLQFVYLPFHFNRGNYGDKVLKTYLWIILAPFYVLYLQCKYHLDLVYCDDSVPIYGFLSKLISPYSRVVIRMGDLQSAYTLADDHPKIFKITLAIETFMWKTVDGIIAISLPFKKFIASRGISTAKISVVEESLNLSVCNAEKSDYNKLKTVFLFNGSIEKCKGLLTLIDAFKLLREQYENVCLIIAGGGSQEHLLMRYIQRKQLPNISLTGWYDHQKLKKIMSRANVGVVMRSSNMANNFVVTTCLLENMGYRKPVIVPNLAAFRGVITDKLNGLLFEAGNHQSLKDKMEEMHLNRTLWESLAEAGHKTVKEKYDHKKIAHLMANTLEEYAKK